MRQGPCSEGPHFLEKTSCNEVNKDELHDFGVVVSTTGKLDKSDWQRMAGAISDYMVREQLS